MTARLRRAGPAALLAAAFAVRLGMALVNERRPLFPAYYYNDAVLYDANARQVLSVWDGAPRTFSFSYGMELYSVWTAWLYRAVAASPMVPQAVNCLLGALCCLAVGATTDALLNRRAGALAALLVAVWPSHVFYTSQNFKEAPSLALLAIALGALAAGLTRRGAPSRRVPALAALGGPAALLLGFFRSHLLLFVAGSAVAGAAALVLRRGPRSSGRAAVVTLAMLAGILLYRPAFERARGPLFAYEGATSDYLRPIEAPEAAAGAPALRPYSPEWISENRRARQYSSRDWARKSSGREVATEIFPDARFKTWGDILVFVPKSSFYCLFMPLPGLYPIEGKLGRAAAALEDLGMLGLSLCAAAGFWTARRRPGAWALAAFFCAAVPAGALFEFDLGSASRHRLATLSALMPLAAVTLTLGARRLRRA